jgi:hypothetical protein
MIAIYNQHLYVAITRARIKLLIIESSENAVAPVVKLLTEDHSKPLVDVTRLHDPNVSIVNRQNCVWVPH